MHNYDLEAAAVKSGLEYEDIKEVLELYFEEADEILNDITAACQNNEEEIIKRLSHSLKGSSSNLSIRNVVHAASQLEELAGTASYDYLLSQVKSLANEVTNARKAVIKAFSDVGITIDV